MQNGSLRLNQLVDAWRANGSPEQEAFPWAISKPKWAELAAEFSVDISEVPELIDRQFLWRLSSSAASVKSSFLAIMIWGYGDIGYGPHRVRQMFASEGFESSMQLVKDLCSDGETIEAYKAIKNSKIRQLGPSFGSKVLTFFHSSNSAPAILDSIVAIWINEHAQSVFGTKGVNAETWNAGTYERYIDWMEELSEGYQVPACNLEQLIFTDGYSS